MQIPDFHPSIVHFPIALLTLGSLAALAYLYWQPTATLRTLTWIPLFLGWVGALLAIFSGLLAQSELPPNAPYRAILNLHTYGGFGVAILYAIPLYRRWLHGKHPRIPPRKRPGKNAEKPRQRDLLDEPAARWWLSGLFVLGLVLILLTGAYGGQLVYDWGVNVQTGP
ncbi:MAG: DUF2231 domain-containing protein [Litorilinea sp.]